MSIAAENEAVRAHLPLARHVVSTARLAPTPTCDRDDLHAAALIGLLTAIRHYQPGRGARLSTFAVHHMRGAARDEWRRARATVTAGRKLWVTPTDSLERPIPDGNGARIQDRLVAPGPDLAAVAILRRRVSELPPHQREATRLYWFEGWQLKEIGARYGITVSGANELVQRALNRLRRRFAQELP